MSKLNDKSNETSEIRYKDIINNILDNIVEVDLKGNFTYVSPQSYDIFGFHPEEVIGTNGLKVIHPEDLPKLVKAMEKAIKTGDIMSAEYRALHKNGHYVYVSARGCYLKDKNRIISVLRNISKQKETEKRLIESENRYRQLIEDSLEGVWVIDDRGNTTMVNPSMAKILGYKVEEMIGKNLFDFVGPDYVEITKSHLEKRRKGIKEEFEKEFICKDGKKVYTRLMASPIFNNSGNYEGSIAFVSDITKRKQAEQQLKESYYLKSEFLRRASHELKTPLISIKGFSDLILSLYKDQLKPEIIINLEEINRGCVRLQNIVNNLIRTSRLESPEVKLKIKKEDLPILIKSCANELESLAKARNHSIALDIHHSLIVNLDKEEIHDVLSNLLSNAIKYTPLNGKILIKTVISEDSVVVSVKDNGIGFTKSEKQKIFQQFGKIKRYNPGLDIDIEGSGLGLYIAKRIVESHGGKIWMESKGKNKGSIFYFSLPMSKK